MPTRKQRKRALKERRHEYETVWVDEEGNELEEPPDDEPAAPRDRRPDAKKPQQKRAQQRSANARTPLPPDWRRAARRSLILGGVIFVFFALVTGPIGAFVLALLYTALFIPFTYYLDRYAYGRYLKKAGQQPKKR